MPYPRTPYRFFFEAKTTVDLLKPVWIFKRCDGIPEIDAVLAEVLGRHRGISLVIHPQSNYWLPVVLSNRVRPSLGS